jgi:hypothetical protein
MHRESPLGGSGRDLDNDESKKKKREKRKKKKGTENEEKGKEKKGKYRVMLTTATSCELAGYLSWKLTLVEPSGNGTSKIVRTSMPLLNGVAPLGNTKRR